MKGVLFTFVLTYGGAAASLFNPFIGLLVYVCFAIVRPEAMWGFALPSGNYSRIVAVALLTGWAMNGFGDWNFGRARGVVWCLIGFAACYVASAVVASNQAVAWADVEAKMKIFVPFVVGMTTIRSLDQVKQLTWVIMLSQGYVAFEMNLSYISGFNRVKELHFGSMDNNCVSIAMACGAGFAFFLGLAEQIRWRRWLSFIAAGLMAHTIMIAESRGGMLALIITGVVSFMLIPKRPIYVAYFVLAIAVGLRLAGPSVWDRFGTTFADQEVRDWSAQSRLDLWTGCVTLMGRHPLLGVGPQHFALVVEEFGYKRGKFAHTLWLQAGAELGIPALALLLGFYMLTMKRLWDLSKALQDVHPSAAFSCRMVIASLVGFMVSAQFVSLSGLELPYYVVLVGASYLKLSDSLLLGDDEFESDLEDDFEDTQDAEFGIRRVGRVAIA
jgi:O-antigen ligase